MKRFFGWLLLVVLFTCLVVGGALGFFWWQADESALPVGGVSLAGQNLGAPAGYSWELPVLGGVLWKPVTSAPGLAKTRLEPLSMPSPALEVTGGLAAEGTALKLYTAGGRAVFEGSAAEWKRFSFEENGEYVLEVRAGRKKTGTKPAQPAGYYIYQCTFSVEMHPALTLSTNAASQGDTVALYISGYLGGSGAPTAQCELGRVWFTGVPGGWLGYLPVTYNAESGEYPVTVTVGEETLTASLTVSGREWSKAATAAAAAVSGAENEKFRNAIWGFYDSGTAERLWNGAFSAPVAGASTLKPYGAYLYDQDNTLVGRSANLSYLCAEGAGAVSPASGRVVFAGWLELTGNTVVIDHGCGVKSYLYGLENLAVAVGAQLSQGQALGGAGRTPIWEVRIGNKSIDPSLLLKGQGGLFYQPRG